MKKNKFYIILAIIAIIFLFSFSALCNQCSAPDEEKIDVGDQEGTDEASGSDEADAQDSDAESDKDDSDDQDDENAGDEDADNDEDDDGDVEAPTIDLVIYEGPIFSVGDGVCYYRIRADVTGKPSPTIVFSKDDSNGSWGSKKVQINIGDPGDSYTLTATATNSEDSDSDSITLTWGCNGFPEITEITFMGDHFTGVEYTFSAAATDPDGDTLSYSWSVAGGSLNSSSGNPVKWTMPGTGGDYDITVEVDDGNGGTATLTESVEVLPALPPPIFNTNIPHVPSEGGYLEEGASTNCAGCLYAGDTDNDLPVKGFISYDITGLAGATIIDAKLTFTLKQEWGDPSFHNNLYINTMNWGPTPIYQGLFSSIGIIIQGFSSSGSGSFICTDIKIKEELQKAIDDGKTRFQVRIHFTGSITDNDGNWDGWEYDQSGVVLNVTGS